MSLKHRKRKVVC